MDPQNSEPVTTPFLHHHTPIIQCQGDEPFETHLASSVLISEVVVERRLLHNDFVVSIFPSVFIQWTLI